MATIYFYQIMLTLCLMLTLPAGFCASHHPQEFLTQIKGLDDEGQQIVEHFCSTCHAVNPLIELGAPKIGEVEDWKFRVKAGLDVLFHHTEEGYNAMPARGGCFECSDEQLRMAIASMLSALEK